MTKQIQKRGKAMPPEEMEDQTPTQPEEGDYGPEQGMEGEQEEPEKYSMQVVRRLHADAIQMLQEYHQMRHHLEHEDIDKWLESKLQNIVGEIEELEGMKDKFHPEAEPLQDAEDSKSLDEDQDEPSEDEDYEEEPEEGDEEPEGDEEDLADEDNNEGDEDDEADSGEEEKPSPEEAFEASEGDEDKDEKKNKHLPRQRRKALPRRVKAKRDDEDVPGDEEFQRKPGRQGVTASAGTDLGDEEDQEQPGEQGVDLSPGQDVGNEEEHRDLPGEPGSGDGMGSVLAPHEQEQVAGANGFLGQLADTSTEAFGPQHRMDAYAWHKALEGICARGGMDTKAMDQNWMEQEDEDKLKNERFHPHRKACMAASKFLKALAMDRAPFGEHHREQARMHQDGLDFITKAEEGADVQEGGNMVEPGEMGEKSKLKKGVKNVPGRNALVKAIDQRGKDLAALAHELNGLTKVL